MRRVYNDGMERETQSVKATLVTDTAVYASGDSLFDPVVIETPSAARRCRLDDVVLIDTANVGPSLELVIFNDGQATVTAKNLAWNLVPADTRRIGCVVTVESSDWRSLGNSKICQLRGLDDQFPMNGSRLQIGGVITQAATLTADALTLTITTTTWP